MRVSAETLYGVWARMIYLSVDVPSEKHNQEHTTTAASAKKIPVIHNQKPPGTMYVVYR